MSIFKEASDLFDEWLYSKEYITGRARCCSSLILKRACIKAYPKNSEWHLRFHDLRHSYAIECLSRGMSTDLVAKQLGDSVFVAEKYYIGFRQNSQMIDLGYRLLNE